MRYSYTMMRQLWMRRTFFRESLRLRRDAGGKIATLSAAVAQATETIRRLTTGG